MTIPTCCAAGCTRAAPSGGLCAAHRRTLLFTTRIQDAVLDVLQEPRGPNLRSAIRPTDANHQRVCEAGTHLAQGIAAVVAAAFATDRVTFEPTPIRYRSTHTRAHSVPRWQVQFTWHVQSGDEREPSIDELDDNDLDDLEERNDDELEEQP